ncbi:uncharacterized protein LOC101847377, partial [Aplysia californica]|uniref:Uncharacterized protein LOC101847377 n=1 Tax=Aplysia californica TaxID=6500 RepID=A0ABM1AAI3_APLCA
MAALGLLKPFLPRCFSEFSSSSSSSSTPSSMTSSSRSLRVCLLLLVLGLTSVAARPKDDGSSSEWSKDWEGVADLWKPNPDDSKDSWRAFERKVDVTTSRWWEDKMDDDLWDPKNGETSEPTSAPHEVTEFCKYDIECPAGRTCVHSVCKCFKP